jgi:hypothetical protein
LIHNSEKEREKITLPGFIWMKHPPYSESSEVVRWPKGVRPTTTVYSWMDFRCDSQEHRFIFWYCFV